MMPVKPVKLQEQQKQDAKPKHGPVRSTVATLHELRQRPQAKPEPGVIPEHRVPIYDHKGRYRGHVGPNGTPATVARFTGQHGAKLGVKDGRKAWLSPPPPPPKKPEKPAQPAQPAGGAAKAQAAKLEISLKTDKGSVTKTPKKPEAHARPRR